MRTGRATFAIGFCLVCTPLSAVSPVEQSITVPGFADFLTVDGDTVWLTNKGRVERWSRKGKLAEVAMSGPCGTMAIEAGSLWVANCKDGTLHRIDLRTATTTAVVATGVAAPDGEMNVVAGAGSVWLASEAKGVIARVDPGRNRVIGSITVDPGSNYLAFGFGSLWAVSGARDTIQQIDPDTNAVVRRTPLGRQPGFLAAGAGGVWVQEQGEGTVVRIDPDTGEATGRIKVDETLKYGDIDTGGGMVWLRTTARQTFVIIDPTLLVICDRVGAEAGSGALRYTLGGVWTTAHDLQTLTWWSDPSWMRRAQNRLVPGRSKCSRGGKE